MEKFESRPRWPPGRRYSSHEFREQRSIYSGTVARLNLRFYRGIKSFRRSGFRFNGQLLPPFDKWARHYGWPFRHDLEDRAQPLRGPCSRGPDTAGANQLIQMSFYRRYWYEAKSFSFFPSMALNILLLGSHSPAEVRFPFNRRSWLNHLPRVIVVQGNDLISIFVELSRSRLHGCCPAVQWTQYLEIILSGDQ